jgi:histidinol dehydrogenase
VTPSPGARRRVEAELVTQVAGTRHRERVETALGNQSAHVLVDDLEQGLQVVDAWAAEHLEVICRDARAWATGSPTPGRSSSVPTAR